MGTDFLDRKLCAEVLRLTKAMRELGVSHFKVGDVEVLFRPPDPPSPPATVTLDPRQATVNDIAEVEGILEMLSRRQAEEERARFERENYGSSE